MKRYFEKAILVFLLGIIVSISESVYAKEYDLGGFSVNVKDEIGISEVKIDNESVLVKVKLISAALLPTDNEITNLIYFFPEGKDIKEKDDKLVIRSKGKVRFKNDYESQLDNVDAADFTEQIEITSDGTFNFRYTLKTLQELKWAKGATRVFVAIPHEICKGKGWMATVGPNDERKLGVIPLEWEEVEAKDRIFFARNMNTFDVLTDKGKVAIELPKEMKGKKFLNWVELTFWTPWVLWNYFDHFLYKPVEREKGYESKIEFKIKLDLQQQAK